MSLLAHISFSFLTHPMSCSFLAFFSSRFFLLYSSSVPSVFFSFFLGQWLCSPVSLFLFSVCFFFFHLSFRFYINTPAVSLYLVLFSGFRVSCSFPSSDHHVPQVLDVLDMCLVRMVILQWCFRLSLKESATPFLR